MEVKLLSQFGEARRHMPEDSAGFYLQCGRHIARCTYRATHSFESNPPSRGGGRRFVTHPTGAIRVPFGAAESIVESLDAAKAWLAETVERSGATLESGRNPESLIVHGHKLLSAINTDSRLYVIASGGGFSCNGFEYQERVGLPVAAWLGDPEAAKPLVEAKGTPAAFDCFQALMERGREHNAKTGARCEAELSPALKGLEGKRVEVTTPDGERSQFRVGRSTGWLPIHLAIEKDSDDGGSGAYVPEGATVKVLDNVR